MAIRLKQIDNSNIDKLGDKTSPSSSYINQKLYEPIRGSISRGLTGQASNLFNVETEEFEKTYKRDKVLLRKGLTEEDLAREKAENQSAMEQFGNAVAQAVGSEVVVGTALGLSNLVDFVANIGRDEGEDDYTNPVSEYLEGVQNDIKERFEIYRKDPNATWAIGDFGWWADNAVSIASTASMLFPTLAVSKGLGALGKLAKLGKVSKGVAKMIHSTPKAASKLSRQINSAAEIGLNATLSRTMEGYLEARDVYKTVYNNTLSKVNEMSSEEKSKLISNNPDLLNANMSDEEIASRIASVSADETFRNDYWMLMFDALQFKALPNIWKGKNTVATAKERLLNKSAIANIGKESQKLADDITFLAKQKEAFKGAINNPLASLMAIEWTEGIEEGYQGIQVEKGKEVGERILNPAFVGRSLDSYLTDPAIWEQAFWGVLGGVGFQAVGRGLGKLQKSIEKGIDKYSLSEQDFNLKHSADEINKRIEIEGRNTKFNNFYANMEALNKGENPFIKQNLLDDFGNPYGDKLSTEQAETLKERYVHQFITDMVLDAADAGNWDLFKDYVQSKEFNEYNKSKLNESDVAFTNSLINQMQDIYDSYNEAMYMTFDTIKVENPNIGRLMARHIVRNEQYIQNLNDILNRLHTEFNKNNNTFSAQEYKDKSKLQYLQLELNQLDVARDAIKDRKDLSKEAKEQYVKEFDKLEKVLVSELNEISGYDLKFDFKDENRNQFLTDLYEFIKNKNYNLTANPYYVEPTDTIKNIANQINKIEHRIKQVNSFIPNGQKEYQELYDEFSITNDRVIRKKYDDAADRILNWVESQKDLDKATQDILESNVPVELKDDLQILKLGHHTTQQFANRINKTIEQIKRDREKEQAKANQVNVSGQPVAQQQATVIQNAANAAVTQTPPSTGKVTQSTPTSIASTSTPSPTPVSPTTEPEPIAAVSEQEYNTYQEELKGQVVVEPEDDEKDLVSKETKLQNIIFTANRELDKDLKMNLVSKDTTSNEFAEYYNSLKAKLAEHGHFNIDEGFLQETAEQILAQINLVYGSNQLQNNIFNAITSIINENEVSKDIMSEVLDKYIEARVSKDDTIDSNNEQTIIDIADFFKYIINNNLVSYFQARLLAKRLYIQLKDTTDTLFEGVNSKYIFENINALKNMDSFFAGLNLENKTIIDKSMHAKSSTKITNNYIRLLQRLKAGDKLIAIRTGRSISFRHVDNNGKEQEVAFLGTVTRTNDGNVYQLEAEPNGGFVYAVSESNGEVISTTDEFFYNLIDGVNDDYKTLYSLIYKDLISKANPNIKGLSNEEKKLAHNLIAKLAGDVYGFRGKPENHVSNAFFEIGNILFYDNKINSKSLRKASYKKWIKKVYKNYKDTYEIQNLINNEDDERLEVEFRGMSGEVLLLGNEHDVSEVVDPDKHPIICRLNGERRLIVEGTGETYENKPGFSVGTMGFLIQDSNGAPMVARIQGKPLSEIKTIANLVGAEISNILTKFQNQEYTFEEVHKRLLDLLGSSQNKVHNLFKGYNVILTNNRILLNIDGTDKFNLVIHKFKKDNSELSTGISYNPEGNRENVKPSTKTNKELIKAIAKEIISKLEFNTTFYTINNNNKPTTTDNHYISKQNNEFVLSLNNTELRYKSFGHFVVESNGYTTNQQLNEEGGYFGLDPAGPDSIYIQTAKVSSPVEEVITPLSVLSSDTGKGVDSKEALRAANESDDYINYLLGNNPANLELIPKKVFFDSTTKGAGAYYDAQKNKIYVTKEGATKSIDLNNPTKPNGNLLRLLIHENIHKQLRRTKDLKRDEIVDGLIETYNLFIKAINEDTTAAGKALRDWIAETGFTPEEYFSKLPINEQKKWNKKSERERLAAFAEEWLAESLSQKALINYLNDITIEEEVVIDNLDDNKKTLFQKIIELLLNLFGKSNKNIQNNTILAKQYVLFNAVVEETTDVNEQANTAQKNNENAPGSSVEINTDDAVTEISDEENLGIDEDIDSDYADMFATTERIKIDNNTIDDVLIETSNNNTIFAGNAAATIESMESYIQQFPIQDQPLIRSMVAKNQIKFVC